MQALTRRTENSDSSHDSAIFRANGDRTAFTPMFTGAQPLMVPSGLDAGLQVLPQEASRASELLASLNTDQHSCALLSTDPPSDIFAGRARQTALTAFKGIQPDS